MQPLDLIERLFAPALLAGALLGWGGELPAAETGLITVPDLSGQWVRIGRYPESFDPPPSGPGPMMIDPAHPHRKSPTPGGQSPDGWVADLSNPILKPETVARMRPIVAAEIAGHSHLKLNDLCFPSGVPMILNSRDPVQVLQSARKVTIIYLRDALTRHIYLD